MAWRFRKSIKIAPGIRMNISKSGISTTIGTKGASINVGKNGTYLNTSIPGTGLYNRKKLSNSSKINSSNSNNSKSMSQTKKNNTPPKFLIVLIFCTLIGAIVSEDYDMRLIYMGIFVTSGIITAIAVLFTKSENDLSEKESNKEVKYSRYSSEIESYDKPCNELSMDSVNVTNDAIELTVADPLFEEAAKYVVENHAAAIHLLEKRFSIGSVRAEHIMQQLEKANIVGPCLGPDFRDVKVYDMKSLESILSKIVVKKKEFNAFDISAEYFDNVSQAIRSLVSFYSTLSEDSTIMDAVDKALPLYCGSKQEQLFLLFFCDCLKNYQRMGYDLSNFDNREGFALVLLECLIMDRKEQNFNIKYDDVNNMIGLASYFKQLPRYADHIYKKHPEEDFFFIVNVLVQCNRIDLVHRFYTSIYRLFSIISKVDNEVNVTEMEWLSKLVSFGNEEKKKEENLDISDESSMETIEVEKEYIKASKKISKMKFPEKQTNPMDELEKLVGLSNVKNDINNLSNLVKIQKMRESRGMKTTNISYHCVFIGNPGTGKTTVARIVAEIYKQLGVLKKGHLIETDRSGLVAEYIGQTASKTNAIIDKAIDGVLFIDEAYSLAQGGSSDYGKEAISTLLKRMEDDRDRLVVILAGYSKEMEDFIDSNSGLQSRFNRYIDFPDYNNEELMEIFNFISHKNDCVATEEALVQIKRYIDKVIEDKDSSFGNARFVRNLFEKIITQQANRLASELNVTNEMLSRIEISDVENALNV